MNTIIEKIKNFVEAQLKSNKTLSKVHSNFAAFGTEDEIILRYLSTLEKEEKSKRVRTFEKEFDGYNSIVITFDKYVLEGIGISQHDKVVVKIQRKED